MKGEPPHSLPPFPPVRPPDSGSPPHFWAMFARGILLLIVSCALCAMMQSPTPFSFGALGAFVSLFFRGYRGIFVGFVVTTGVVYLAFIVICSALGNPHF
jgi:hypothetical protein